MKFCRPPPQLLSKRIKLCLEIQKIVFGSTPCPPPTSWWWRWATWSEGWAGSHSEAGCLMGSFHSLKRRDTEIMNCFHRNPSINCNSTLLKIQKLPFWSTGANIFSLSIIKTELSFLKGHVIIKCAKLFLLLKNWKSYNQT